MNLENKTINVSSEQLRNLEKVNPGATKRYYWIRGELGKYYTKKIFDYFVEGLDCVSKNYLFSQ